MPRRWFVPYLAAVMAAWACSVAADGAEDRGTCKSWVATARMVAEGWLDNELPQHYAVDTLAKAAAKLDRIAACGDTGRSASELKSAISSGEALRARQALVNMDAGAREGRASP